MIYDRADLMPHPLQLAGFPEDHRVCVEIVPDGPFSVFLTDLETQDQAAIVQGQDVIRLPANR